MIRTSLVVVLLFVTVLKAADGLTVLPAKTGGVAPKEMMHAYLMRLAGEAFDRRTAAYEKLKTPEQLAARQKAMRAFFVEALGGFPDRTPLNAKVVAKEKRDGYRIEKVIFESRPRHFVTAVLYLPDAKPPFPGVLVPCGHSHNGKAAGAYQSISILLARNGMAAFCYDPIDQGERFQLLDDAGKPVVGGTTAHSLLGVGSTLLGVNTATFRIWDGMRAIDYLAGRPEVDAKQIGCTGNSGGGTLTSYLMALDERIVCAAPSCYLTSLRRLVETIGPQDAEQNIHAQIARGMDHADYAMIRAPRPTLICCATRDFFDIGGTWDTFRQAKRFYGRLGFAERVDLAETDAKHGFGTPLREATVRWMRRWLMGIDEPVTEGEIAVSSDAEMQCTPRGQVMLLEGARSTYDVNIALARELAGKRTGFSRAAVRRITGIRRLADLPEPEVRTAGEADGEGHRVVKLVIEPEEGIRLPTLAFVPARRRGSAVLYVHGEGKQAAVGSDGPVGKLVADGRLVLAVDLRGMGETSASASRKRGIAHYVGGDWKDLYLAYLLGRSYLSMRAEDILVCARFLAGYGGSDKPQPVALVSMGRTGPAALHAAALEPDAFASIAIEGSLASWSSIVGNPPAAGHFENVVHGALRSYDLPDLVGAIPRKRLQWKAPVDALGRPAGR